MSDSGILPPLLDVKAIQQRLEMIFPEGSPNRGYCTRELAARTIFVMLYIGAIEDAGRWLRPDQVTRMTDLQSSKISEEERRAWTVGSLKPMKEAIPGRWYAQNTREPIRDETLRNGLIPVGAVVDRKGLPTTSSHPRYALSGEFSELFGTDLSRNALAQKIAAWQEKHLSSSALARVQLMRRAVVASQEGILVEFPNGETRRMAWGPSSVITKAVIEEFTKHFLEKPGVVWVSESEVKVVARDDHLAQAIGLNIRPDLNLPDIILVDLGPQDPLLIFVEVVATDGPVNDSRRQALLRIATDAGFGEQQTAFVTAYLDRDKSAFRKTFPSVAWQSFVWCVSEPQDIIALYGQAETGFRSLSELMKR